LIATGRKKIRDENKMQKDNKYLSHQAGSKPVNLVKFSLRQETCFGDSQPFSSH
jgi:hypothetical protein